MPAALVTIGISAGFSIDNTFATSIMSFEMDCIFCRTNCMDA
jgi:hypothetical protein